MAKLMMGCGENEQIVFFVYFFFFCVHCFFLCTLFFLCTQKKQKKKTYICFILFFLCTQILGLIISHCAKKHCLWHALDSRFRTLASYFSYCTKMESCKNLFCALSFSPLKSFLLRQEISRERGLWLLNSDNKKMFLLVQTCLGGQSYCSPPFNPLNPVSS